MRLRFAPSPTGNLHIGTMRAALFNYLYAQHHGGKIILRIEDTDIERSDSKYEETIFDGLNWLSIAMDESPVLGGKYGPYRQSERHQAGLYKKAVQQLLDSKHAYYCFCTEDDLHDERERAKVANIPYIYSRKCCSLSSEAISEKLSLNIPYTIRFKMPDQTNIIMKDLIRNDIEFDLKLISDFILMKSDQTPSYNFAVVVDDIAMEITHVIRGEDHISNTPKQIALFHAFDKKEPVFAHLPMILGTDKTKLSKRHDATNVIEYKERGYLPEALFNYLSLLGWSSTTGEEILAREDIISEFEFDRVSKSNAVFDIEKLNWMNGQYIRLLSSEELLLRLEPYFNYAVRAKLVIYSLEEQQLMMESVQDNLRLLSEINEYLTVFLEDDFEYYDRFKGYKFTSDDAAILECMFKYVDTFDDFFTEEDVAVMLDSILHEIKLGKGVVFKTLRFALTAQKSGPNLLNLLLVFNYDKIKRRLEMVLGRLNAGAFNIIDTNDEELKNDEDSLTFDSL